MNAPGAPLRVCRIISRLNIGGPARHVALLDRGLRERGFETILAFGHVAPGEASLERLVHDFGNPSQQIEHLGRRVSFWSDALALTALVRLLFRVQPDVVHTHAAKAGSLGRVAAALFNATRRRHRRCVVLHTFHGNVFEGYFGAAMSTAVRATERLLARLTDRIAVISTQQCTDIVDRHRIAPARKVSIVPLGLDLGELRRLSAGAPSLRPELGLEPHDLVVGYVGRFAPIKDLQTLLDAFSMVALQEPRARLVMTGDGETRPAVQAAIRDAGLASRVVLTGWRHDLPALYATFDVLALTSINEGTPVAVIEAMAAGLPVVSTAAGGVIDLVETGTTGLLAPIRDITAIADALMTLLASKAERERMGAAGRARAARYDHTRLVDDIEQLYRGALIAKRRSRRSPPTVSPPPRNP